MATGGSGIDKRQDEITVEVIINSALAFTASVAKVPYSYERSSTSTYPLIRYSRVIILSTCIVICGKHKLLILIWYVQFT